MGSRGFWSENDGMKRGGTGLLLLWVLAKALGVTLSVWATSVVSLGSDVLRSSEHEDKRCVERTLDV